MNMRDLVVLVLLALALAAITAALAELRGEEVTRGRIYGSVTSGEIVSAGGRSERNAAGPKKGRAPQRVSYSSNFI